MGPGPDCPPHGHIELPLAVFSAILSLFGLFYLLFGYRCLRAAGFVSGLVIGAGSIFIAIIIKQGPILGQAGDIALAVCIGVLAATVGSARLFAPPLCGALTGALLCASGIALHAALRPEHDQGLSVWSIFSALIASAAVYALFALHWTKSLTVLSTSVLGSCLLLLSCDYFVQDYAGLSWLHSLPWTRQPINETVVESTTTAFVLEDYNYTTPINNYTNVTDTSEFDEPWEINAPCWTWLMVTISAPLVALGVSAQCCITARGVSSAAAASAARRKSGLRRSRSRDQPASERQRKYRYLYQVRTAHGDVISQSFVAALQRKAHPGSANTGGPGETSTLQSDATHLTILPGEIHENDP